MSRRLYLGRLPTDARTDDVSKFFEGYGKIVDCRVMTGFGFVEFESSRDAEDALNHFNGKPFMGTNLVVEFAKESRPRRDPYDDRAPRARRPPGIRIIVSGISRDTSWQDLKDFGREAGSVSFADIERDVPGQGVLEYLAREDAERAVKDLDGKDLRGQPVRVALSEDRGADSYSRRDDRYERRDRYERPSYRDERPSYRGRSRSPPPRRHYDDDRRARSPPPRRDYDDKRSAAIIDDRRPADVPDRDRDHDRPRRDDRRDDRYEDRRGGGGDGGWR
ncbi:uncharacterized protein STEHIDRAFT_128672 [Stereum hirsutum FP-91666 SS1]|uniref:uncharacterized protein n=1 Tax=Stereum hirsutum (strain FP-91666) TaxID=721885 RepID=UPI000440EFF3|nr:uncharacterized protein STEHIDRAFT_128672 [Stereum hirsutum FP-91666 SS1]EIM89771.1 hypothetical protein STEHIDRAFT_128672 [Stereum hirsutum FP-91666 SS1]